MLPQHQQLTSLQHQSVSVDDVPRFSGAHVHHFHVVMAVFGECHKTCMRPDRDDPTRWQQLVSGYYVPCAVHVAAPVDVASPVQNLPLLIGNPGKFLQYHVIHPAAPLSFRLRRIRTGFYGFYTIIEANTAVRNLRISCLAPAPELAFSSKRPCPGLVCSSFFPGRYARSFLEQILIRGR